MSIFDNILKAHSPRNKNMTNDTVKVRSALDEISTDGEFKRTDSAWRNWISNVEGAEFPPEDGRYHLYVAYACPWAHRTLMVRGLKGLQDCITVTVVHPTWRKTKDDPSDSHCGWVFGDPEGEPFPNTIGLGSFPPAYPDNEPDPVFNSFSIRELYERAGDTEGKYTVPILWDKKQNTIVSNESSEIIQMLNSQFNQFAKNPDLDLEPAYLKGEMKSVDEWIYPTLNNGVYRCGFASSQKAYDTAIDELTDSFDRVEKILMTQRFIAGDQLTLSDIRLFATLLRFDEVYTVYFKCNTRSVRYTPAILNYCREIYQLTGIRETVNMEQIKVHYFTSHPNLNKFSIVPRGTNFLKLLDASHDRASFAKKQKCIMD